MWRVDTMSATMRAVTPSSSVTRAESAAVTMNEPTQHRPDMTRAIHNRDFIFLSSTNAATRALYNRENPVDFGSKTVKRLLWVNL